jgi:hypothetical protein
MQDDKANLFGIPTCKMIKQTSLESPPIKVGRTFNFNGIRHAYMHTKGVTRFSTGFSIENHDFRKKGESHQFVT